MGFIIPLTFVDTDDSEKLREMFKPNGCWKILEIVDLEQIKRLAFPTANVRPIILIAQNAAPTLEDEVELRLVNHECVQITNEGENINFDFDRARSCKMPYEQIWSQDGRILTRITPERRPIIERLIKLRTIGDITHRYWDLMRGSSIIKRSFLQGEPTQGCRWVEKNFLIWGAAARGQDASDRNGIALYKGENISACQLVGDPIQLVDPSKFDDASVWRFPKTMPPTGVAFSRISIVPTGVEFNPEKLCF